MNTKKLDQLLEKYYKGDSTLEEEQILRQFFMNSNVPEGYEAEKMIFGYYSEEAGMVEPSVGFEERIMARVDEADNEKKARTRRNRIIPYISVAAGILILTGSYFFFSQKSAPLDTYSDPRIAYAETMKVLLEVSNKLNQGTQALEPVGKMNDLKIKSFQTINKSTSIVQKNLRSMDYLQKGFELSNVQNKVVK